MTRQYSITHSLLILAVCGNLLVPQRGLGAEAAKSAPPTDIDPDTRNVSMDRLLDRSDNATLFGAIRVFFPNEMKNGFEFIFVRLI